MAARKSSKSSKSDYQKSDKFQLVTDKIIALMERGVSPWQKPWHSVPYGNLLTGKAYQGMNPLLCAIDCMYNNYQSPYFLGFHQGSEMGWKVRKGSKATWIRWGGSFAKEVELEDGTTEKQFFSGAKWMQVFNIECFDDSESEKKIADYVKVGAIGGNTDDRNMTAEEFISKQKAVIRYFGDVACYSSSKDEISMPVFADFTSAEGYYATHLHELTHWSGHHSRLNRELGNQFGSQKYAFEELIAELGSAFICNELGISSTIENHASYLDNWLQILKGDSKAFFKAATAAQKAATFLMNNAGLTEATESIESPEAVAV